MFTVKWTKHAINQLTAIWLKSSDRNAVTRAVADADRRLARDALNEGESRAGKTRITFSAPLGLEFRVDETQKLVVVHSVWSIKPMNLTSSRPNRGKSACGRGR